MHFISRRYALGTMTVFFSFLPGDFICIHVHFPRLDSISCVQGRFSSDAETARCRPSAIRFGRSRLSAKRCYGNVRYQYELGSLELAYLFNAYAIQCPAEGR